MKLFNEAQLEVDVKIVKREIFYKGVAVAFIGEMNFPDNTKKFFIKTEKNGKIIGSMGKLKEIKEEYIYRVLKGEIKL